MDNTILQALFIILAVLIYLLFALTKKEWIVYAIIITLFLEANVYSFYLFGARIRISQVLLCMGLLLLVLRIFMRSFTLIKVPLDGILWTYMFVNTLSIVNAPSMQRGIKIAILLLSLILLYCLVLNIVKEKKIFDRVFNLLIFVGLVEIVYGLYQVFAGMSNIYLKTNLYIGYAGIAHASFINSPWGRPYGTFVEPDWYGAICMFYALLFLVLYYSKIEENKNVYLFGLIVSTVGLLLSFVRANWIGFFVGIAILLFCKKKIKLLKFNIFTFIKMVFVLVVFTYICTIISPSFCNIIQKRFSNNPYSESGFSLKNVRAQQMIRSMQVFFNSPVIGNGPGSFSYLGIWGDSEAYYNQQVAENKLSIESKCDPSIITTVLTDTGIMGFIVFLLLCLKYWQYNIKKIPLIKNKYQVYAFAFFVGNVALFSSFIFNNGFWIPFTWVFLALNIVVLRIGIMENNII